MAVNDWWEGKPEAGWQYWLGQGNINAPAYTDWMSRRFQDTYNKYLGQVGVDPTLRWMDYIAGLAGGGPNAQRNLWRGLSSYQQGQNVFAPIFRMIS